MKKIIRFFLLIALFAGLLLPSFISVKANELKVIDNADLLTQQQEDDLLAAVNECIEEHQIDVVILTTNTLDGKDIINFADDFYDFNGYGIGEDNAGILLVIDMSTRTYKISTCGKAIQYVTDFGEDEIYNAMYSNIANGQYFDCCLDFLNEVDYLFDEAESGHVVDVYYFDAYFCDEKGNPVNGTFKIYDANGYYFATVSTHKGYMHVDNMEPGSYKIVCQSVKGDYELFDDIYIDENTYNFNFQTKEKGINPTKVGGISLGSGVAGAFAVCSALKAKNKSVSKKYTASDYVKRGSFRVNSHHDSFLTSRLYKTLKPKDTDSGSSSSHSSGGFSSGGSSTHFSSSGVSHGGGSGRGF